MKKHSDRMTAILLAVGIAAGLLFVMLSRFGGSDMIGDGGEERLKALIEVMDGVEDAEVMIYREDELVGIAVVCRADDGKRADIAMMISALYGISASNVYVTSR